jgi:hypothetical protein
MTDAPIVGVRPIGRPEEMPSDLGEGSQDPAAAATVKQASSGGAGAGRRPAQPGTGTWWYCPGAPAHTGHPGLGTLFRVEPHVWQTK